MIRGFCSELKEENFKQITYTIFNKMDDEQYIKFLENKFNDLFSIEDFKYYDFDLTDKERFLIKMHNKEFLKNVKNLKECLNNKVGIKVYVDYNSGNLRVVKLNCVMI